MALLALLAAGPAAAQGAGTDWTARLPVFALALRGCLEGDAAAYADAVARQQAFAVAVRVRRGAEAELCVARPDGRVLRRGPVDAPPPDPAAPAFFLDRRCADARRMEDDHGQVLGWLAYPGC